MFDFKMVSKAVLYVHVILCGYFIVLSNPLGLPIYLVVYAGISAIFGIIITAIQDESLQKITKFCAPVLLIGLVTLYGFNMERLGVITVLILAITCISSLYADFKVTGLIILYTFLLYIIALKLFPEVVYGTKNIDGQTIYILNAGDVFINLFSLFLGQIMIVILLMFCKNAINTSKNKTSQVEELLTEVEIKRREAERADKAKSDFLANMSHEIRTPMNAICGMVELLMQNDLSTTEYEYVNTIKVASNGLLGIVNDILDFSKIEAGKLEILEEEYNISSTINDVINIINTKIDMDKIAFNVNINPNLPMIMYGDEIRVKQIALNILTNAAKFTNEGFISFNIDYKKVKSNTIEVTIEVNDSGIGIKREHLEEIFDEFKQVDTRRNRNIQGTGLGLAICRKLALLMGGTINIESEYGVGTLCRITFLQHIKSMEPCAIVKDPNKCNVIVYDENKYSSNSISRLFDSLGIKHEIVDDFDEYKVLINCKNYTHIFFDYDSAIEYMSEYEKNNHESALIAMYSKHEYTANDENENNIMIINKPIHYLTVVPILNGENPNAVKSYHTENTFVAPEAHILLVDDNVVNIRVAEGLLKNYEVQVTSASGGFEAIDIIRENPVFDLILMDHMMPQIDGVDTVKIIRNSNDSYCKKVPIVAFSANALKEAQMMFLENGFDDFLAKPIEIKALKQLLLKWIPKNKQIKQVASNQHKTEKTEPKISLNLRKIDVHVGLESCMGDEEAYKEILLVFAKSGDKNISLINESAKNLDIKNFTTYVHSIKSSAKSIGALELSEDAKSLESAGKDEDWEYINLYLFDFIADYKTVIKTIFDNIEEPNEDILEKNSVSSKELQITLEKLVEAADNYDSDSADTLISKLKSFSLSSQLESVVKKAETMMAEFEYEELSESIKLVLNNFEKYL